MPPICLRHACRHTAARRGWGWGKRDGAAAHSQHSWAAGFQCTSRQGGGERLVAGLRPPSPQSLQAAGAHTGQARLLSVNRRRRLACLDVAFVLFRPHPAGQKVRCDADVTPPVTWFAFHYRSETPWATARVRPIAWQPSLAVQIRAGPPELVCRIQGSQGRRWAWPWPLCIPWRAFEPPCSQSRAASSTAPFGGHPTTAPHLSSSTRAMLTSRWNTSPLPCQKRLQGRERGRGRQGNSVTGQRSGNLGCGTDAVILLSVAGCRPAPPQQAGWRTGKPALPAQCCHPQQLLSIPTNSTLLRGPCVTRLPSTCCRRTLQSAKHLD